MHEDSGEIDGRAGRVPWTAPEVLLALLLVSQFWPAAAYQFLLASGFYRRHYGDELVALASADPAHPEAADGALTTLRNQAYYRLKLWATVLAFPFQAVTIPLLLYGASGTRPEQLGLTAGHLGRNLLAGTLGAVVLTPVVQGVNWLVKVLYLAAGAGGVQEHPLTQVARQGPAPAEWVLLVLTAMLAAPVLEELMFRGMLQPWLAARRWGGHAAMAATLVLALLACRGRAGPLLERAAPVEFVLILVPFYLAVWRRSRTPVPPAIFGTALLFAYVHVDVWPDPVALFVLALGLGVLAWRTRSLVGPILLHSLFNGVSCVRLLLEG
jgi:membrane protease YdiL (CAAX protease family)